MLRVLGWMLLVVSLGMLSGWVAAPLGEDLWYTSLAKPEFTPPGWIFGPVWLVLYIILGLVLSEVVRLQLVWVKQLFWAHLGLNFIWSLVFFKFHLLGWALVVLSLLWLSLLLILLIPYIISRWWLLPYFLWINFAWLLNYNIYILN